MENKMLLLLIYAENKTHELVFDFIKQMCSAEAQFSVEHSSNAAALTTTVIVL